MGAPARRYSWAPFQRGHMLSVRSGHTSARIVSSLAEELVTAVLADRPDLDDIGSRVILSSWASATAIAALILRRLDEVGVFGADGELLASLLKERRAEERRAQEAARELGLTAGAYAKLVRDRADAQHATFDLGAAVAKGQAIAAERAAIEAGDDAP